MAAAPRSGTDLCNRMSETARESDIFRVKTHVFAKRSARGIASGYCIFGELCYYPFGIVTRTASGWLESSSVRPIVQIEIVPSGRINAGDTLLM